jgi:hypothetical protein
VKILILPKAREVKAEGLQMESIEDIVQLYSMRKWSGYAKIEFEEGAGGRGVLLFVNGRLAGYIYQNEKDFPLYGEKALKLIMELMRPTEKAEAGSE